jgi:hypothetical protein
MTDELLYVKLAQSIGQTSVGNLAGAGAGNRP